MPAARGEPREILALAGRVKSPAYSPDGAWMAGVGGLLWGLFGGIDLDFTDLLLGLYLVWVRQRWKRKDLVRRWFRMLLTGGVENVVRAGGGGGDERAWIGERVCISEQVCIGERVCIGDCVDGGARSWIGVRAGGDLGLAVVGDAHAAQGAIEPEGIRLFGCHHLS